MMYVRRYKIYIKQKRKYILMILAIFLDFILSHFINDL
jgi:hypothetical protein